MREKFCNTKTGANLKFPCIWHNNMERIWKKREASNSEAFGSEFVRLVGWIISKVFPWWTGSHEFYFCLTIKGTQRGKAEESVLPSHGSQCLSYNLY
jgi:hypothetical protein